MNVKCSVYIAASVDGFIAKSDGDIEWLHRPEYSGTSINGLTYDEFISTVDVLIMGRNTFEKVKTFDVWPYEGTLVTVLTNKKFEIPPALKGKIRIEAGQPKKILSKLQKEGSRHFYIDGGITIQRFLQEKLVNELTITRIPLILGNGIPLFNYLREEQPLKLIEVNKSENGFVQERYKVLEVEK